MDRSTIHYYDENAEKLSELYETADMSIVHSLLLRFLPEKVSVLEIGCGSGRDAGFLMAKGYDVTAIEASPKMLQVAQSLHPELAVRITLVVCLSGILTACCLVSSERSCASEP